MSDDRSSDEFASGMDAIARALDPQEFAKGVALIEKAAADGLPDALCQVATFEAVGAGRERNWNRAFDLLQRAAGLGSSLARDQLGLLKGDGAGAADDWAALRSSIEIRKLLASAPTAVLSDDPQILTIGGFATAEECDWIVNRFRPKLQRAQVWDSHTNAGIIDPVRSNSAVEVGIASMDVVIAVIRARISAAIKFPEPLLEVQQVMHYTPGQEFEPHFDFLDPQLPGQMADIAHRGQRVATFLIFLNEDYEGGETEFPRLGIRHRGRTGDALIFVNVTPDRKPDPRTLHAGCPPTTGEKWIVSQWIRDRMPG